MRRRLAICIPPQADKKFQRGERGDDDAQHEREIIGMERSKVEQLTAKGLRRIKCVTAVVD